MLNQPQVADKRIWIESQQGLLPADAGAVGYAGTGISGTGSERLMRKEKSLSPALFLPPTVFFSPILPSSPMSLPGEQLF